MARVASFHLGMFPARRALSRLVSLPAERWELEESPGLVLGRVVSTSSEGTTRISAALGRWAVFAVWEDDDALAGFLAGSPLMRRWSSRATRVEHFHLTPLASRGTWGGVNPFPGMPERSPHATDGQQVAVLTHATIRPGKALAFLRAVPAVDDALRRRPGNVMALGIGRWPFVQQATFSIWESEAALRDFAYGPGEHLTAIRRAHRERWFGEELFCRFAARPMASAETVGHDSEVADEASQS